MEYKNWRLIINLILTETRVKSSLSKNMKQKLCFLKLKSRFWYQDFPFQHFIAYRLQFRCCVTVSTNKSRFTRLTLSRLGRGGGVHKAPALISESPFCYYLSDWHQISWLFLKFIAKQGYHKILLLGCVMLPW